MSHSAAAAPAPPSAAPKRATCPACRPARKPWGGTVASRLGAAAFMFFLIKGLAWLLVPAALAVWAAM
ncbi:MAG: hypothetical protein AB7K52_08605 [Phycisphaerales bacterium]